MRQIEQVAKEIRNRFEDDTRQKKVDKLGEYYSAADVRRFLVA